MRRIIFGVGCALALAAQLIPVDRANPPVLTNVDAPADVRAIITRACFDCHSNETRWPWYARVAPVSWLVSHDVTEGRAALNFSEWDLYEAEEQIDLIDLVGERVRTGEMPPALYLPLHSEARLDENEIRVLEGWSNVYEPTLE